MKTPFTTEQFFAIIEKYNSSVFPVQLVLLLLGLVAVIFIHSKKTGLNRSIGGFLGLVWIWAGIAYHLSFFTEINKAAWGFGGIFILQGIFIFIELFRKKLIFSFNRTTQHYIGYFFIIFGLMIYPVISYLTERSFPDTISLGLPCPTTILTFGFFMLTSRKFSRYLLIIPTLWAVIGTGAAINFGVYQDYVMLLAAIVADIYLLGRKKSWDSNYFLSVTKFRIRTGAIFLNILPAKRLLPATNVQYTTKQSFSMNTFVKSALCRTL